MLRRETCLQLDAFMVTQQADILEHERYHIPRLPHACVPSKSAYACIMEQGLELNGQKKAVLTEAECRIMSHKLLQCDPNKVWTMNHLHTFSNQSDRRISSAGGSEGSSTASTDSHTTSGRSDGNKATRDARGISR